jgi:hypothetical protein
MRALVLFCILAVLMFGCQKYNQYRNDLYYLMAIIGVGSPILQHLSTSWSYDLLAEKIIDPDYLRGHEDEYREMLERASSLGVWKNKCSDARVTNEGPSWEPKKVTLIAACQFQNGFGEVTIVAHRKRKIVFFNVEKKYKPSAT